MKRSKQLLGSRRRFLKDLAKCGMSAPWLNATLSSAGVLWARGALAQDEDAPMRYVLGAIGDSGGATPSRWHSTQYGSNFTLPRDSANFEPWKNRMIFFDNVQGHGEHTNGHRTYIANSSGDSIDSYMAKTIGSDAPYSHTRLPFYGNGRSSYANGSSINPSSNPLDVYRSFFGTGEASVTIDGLDLDSARFISVLNTNREYINELRSALSQVQRERLEDVENAIDQTEASIRRRAANQSGACASPGWDGASYDSVSGLDEATMGNLLIDVAALALKCDMTRVVTFTAARNNGELVPVLGLNSHTVAHEGSGDNSNKEILRRWFNDQFIRLMTSLDSSTDADGNTILYNSVIHHVTDFGDGQSHGLDRVPVFLAGNGGGRLNVGQNINAPTDSYFQIFDAVAEATGVINNADYPAYGGRRPLAQALL